jgi:DNA-binding beta-propeller fold protein YncE
VSLRPLDRTVIVLLSALLGIGCAGPQKGVQTPSPSQAAADRCAEPDGHLLNCLLKFKLPVPDWTDRALPRGQREGGPKALLLPPGTDEVWVAVLVGPPAIRIYSRTSGKELAQVALGEEGLGAVEFEITTDGKTVYVSQLESSRVYEVDRASKDVLRVLSAHGEWPKILELSADESKLYVSNWTSGNIAEIDLATGDLARDLPGTVVPRGLYATRDGSSLYVAGFGSGELRRIDLTSGHSEVLFKEVASLRHIVADEDRDRLFISDLKNARILRHHLSTGLTSVFAEVHPKPNTIRLSRDGRLLFVSSRGPNNPVNWLDPGPEWGAISVFDTDSGALLDLFVAGNQPTGMDLSADGRTLATSDFIDNRIRIFAVPPSDAFSAGPAPRVEAARLDLPKKEWNGWIPDDEVAPEPP